MGENLQMVWPVRGSKYSSYDSTSKKHNPVKKWAGTPLVIQWLRTYLTMQGIVLVPWLGTKTPTCCEATKPVRQNYWACSLQLQTVCATMKGPIWHN